MSAGTAVGVRSARRQASCHWRSVSVGLVTLVFGLACSDSGGDGPTGPPSPSSPTPSPNPGVVASEPVALPASALSVSLATRGLGHGAGLASGISGDVSYVHFKPGTFAAEATVAWIENLETGHARWARVVYGGIDPVPLEAEPGDSLEVSIYDDGPSQAPLSQVRIGVPVAHMPEVVRAEPAKGRTAVPINRSVRIVFSEPVEPSTITPQTIQLRTAGQPVTATLEIQPDGFTVVLRPAAWLQPNSEYEIAVSGGVQDLSGEPLIDSFSSTFTTASTSGEIFVRRLHDLGQINGIWAVNPDGTGLRPIVSSERFRFWELHISPDGRKIAFSGGYDNPDNPLGGFDGDVDIWVMDTDGRNWSRLTDRGGWDDHPRWSPDGTKIAFSSERGEDWSNIYVMDLNGGPLISAGRGWAEDWSPDGTKILFYDWDEETLPSSSLWSMNADGTGRTLLVEDILDAAWSPDGTRIAFTRRTGSFTCINNPEQGLGPKKIDIFLMRPDGSEISQVTDTPKQKGQLVWSPDGTQIAYAEQYDGGFGCGSSLIAVMNADGSGRYSVTGTDGGSDWYVSWR